MNGSDDKSLENAQGGEVLPKEEQEGQRPPSTQNVLALIASYTARPDLFLDAMEKHDPGFVTRMNRSTEKNAKRTRNIKEALP